MFIGTQASELRTGIFLQFMQLCAGKIQPDLVKGFLNISELPYWIASGPDNTKYLFSKNVKQDILQKNIFVFMSVGAELTRRVAQVRNYNTRLFICH